MTPEWRVSTISRRLGAAIAFAAGGGLVLGALVHGGDPHKKGGGPATDALFSPLSLGIAAGAVAITVALLWIASARLEGGATWLRRVRPAPPVTIGVGEVVHVTRTRPKLMGLRGRPMKEVAQLSFTVRTADGRSIVVGEAGVMREPRLLQVYEAAMASAIEATLRGLAAGQPYQVNDLSLDGRRLVWRSGAAITLPEIAMVVVEVGTSAEVSIVDRMQRPGALLPDDELLLRVLARLGIPIHLRRASA